MQPFAVTVDVVAPVPVGHRVQLRWLQMPVRNIAVFGADTMSFEPRPREPVIIDLETGITYGSSWAIDESGRPRTELPVEREASGRVARCAVVWAREHSFTRLEIAPDPAGYRR
jgi:hypothetical protein